MFRSCIFRFLPAVPLLAVALLLIAPRPASTAELVMFESPTCSWCVRWLDEIGGIYPRTKEARCAPLRRVDIHDPRPDDLSGLKSVTYTPTFVLVDDGRELGRIVGYPGEDFFWAMLDRELAKLGDACPSS